MSLENLTDDQIKNLAELSQSLSSNPATRRDFQRLIKKNQPNSVIPELEVEDAVARVTEQATKDKEELKAEIDKRDIASKRRDLKDKLEREYPHIAFDDIEKAMVDHAIGNHESAAKFVYNERRLAEPAPEVPGRGGPMMMPTEAKQFFKSPTQVARKLAHQAVTEIITNRQRQRAA